MCQNCDGAHLSAADAAPVLAAESAANRAIVASVQPGFTATINMRLLPARDVIIEVPKPTCQPRADAAGQAPQTSALPQGLAGRLLEASKAVVAWLTKDPANAELFLNNPVAALSQAGVDLARVDAKALARSHNQVRQQAVVPPGAVVSKLTVHAAARGKVGDQRPGKAGPKADSQGGSSADCGC
jgi:hypothetical protein